jgi:hypothetical protein
MERLLLWDISLLNNWSCSLIHRACRSTGDAGESTVSVAMAAVTVCSMPSKSVRINCSSSSKDTYTAIFLESQDGQKYTLSYRNIRLPQELYAQRPIGDTLQGMLKGGVITAQGRGPQRRYVLAE